MALLLLLRWGSLVRKSPLVFCCSAVAAEAQEVASSIIRHATYNCAINSIAFEAAAKVCAVYICCWCWSFSAALLRRNKCCRVLTAHAGLFAACFFLFLNPIIGARQRFFLLFV